jgi:D-arabinose 5-phosphate isomerase GutQ
MSNESTQETRRAEQQAHFTQAHIDIAVLKVVVESLVRENQATQQEIKAMGEQVAAMNTLLSEAKGGWKVIAAVAGAAGVIGSALSWFLAHLGIVKT